MILCQPHSDKVDELVIEDASRRTRNVRFGDCTPKVRYVAFAFSAPSVPGRSETLKQSEGCVHVFSEEELPV